MSDVLSFVNAACSALIALAIAAAILSHHVHDGIVIKAGLIVMCAGFAAVAVRMADGVQNGDAVGLMRALFLIHAGLCVVIGGYLWRKHRHGHSLRRASDWAELDTRPYPHDGVHQ